MQFTAAQIAQFIQGFIEGNPEATVHAFGKIEEAAEGELAFLANPKYEEYLYKTQASVVIINQSLDLKQPVSATLIRVPEAYLAFATLLDIYQQYQTAQLTGTESPSFVHETAIVEEQVFIGAFTYIDAKAHIGKGSKIHQGVFIGANVKIGENTILFPGVKIYHDCIIGAHVTIHANTVIGADGFGFAPKNDKSLKKVPQIGNVVIDDHVEIGANSTIDRATIGSTRLHEGVKIDNLVQIAHNVEIGEHTVVAALTGISGSTKIGKHVMIGGQAGIVGHITIADGTKINGKSGVSKSIEVPNKAITGNPAQDFKTEMRNQALIRKLPEMEKRIKELEALIQKLVSD